QVDVYLLVHGVDVVAPGIVVDEDVNGKIVFFVQPARQAPDTAGRLAVACEQDTVVPAPEFVFRKTVPLGSFLNEENKIRGAFADLNVFRLDNGGNGI